MYYLFIDESGDHNYKTINNCPIFVLTGCIFSDRKDHLYYLNAIKNTYKLKTKYFNHFYINLHTNDIIRNKEPFGRIEEPRFREEFFQDCNNLLLETNFILICSVVYKQDLKSKYGNKAADPYFYSFDRLIERFVRFLEDDEPRDKDKKGIIFYENRRQDLDKKLEQRFSFIMENGVINLNGTINVTSKRIKNRIVDLIKLTKESNTAGIEISDLCASPISRHFNGFPDNFIKYDIVKSKYRSVDGKIEGYGLIQIK
jgi:hypothetical protein